MITVFTLLFLHTYRESACIDGPYITVRLAFTPGTSTGLIREAMRNTFTSYNADEKDDFDSHLLFPIDEGLRMLTNEPARKDVLVWEDRQDEDDIMQFVVVKSEAETPSLPVAPGECSATNATIQSLMDKFLSEHPNGDSFELARFMYKRGLEKTTEQPEDSAS